MKSHWLKKAVTFYRKYRISFLISIVASIVMFIFNLVSYFRSGGLMYAVFALFFLGMAIIRTILFLENLFIKDGDRVYYYTTSVSLFLLLPYITGSLVYLAYIKGPIHFPFSFLIYGYAAYAFYKMISAILFRHRAKTADKGRRDPYLYCLSYLSFISALYTMVSLATNLVYFKQNEITGWFQTMEYIMVSVGSLFSFIGVFHLLHEGRKAGKKKRNKNALTEKF